MVGCGRWSERPEHLGQPEQTTMVPRTGSDDRVLWLTCPLWCRDWGIFLKRKGSERLDCQDQFVYFGVSDLIYTWSGAKSPHPRLETQGSHERELGEVQDTL